MITMHIQKRDDLAGRPTRVYVEGKIACLPFIMTDRTSFTMDELTPLFEKCERADHRLDP